MYFRKNFFIGTLVCSAFAQGQTQTQEGFLGFNSGATLDNNKAKVQSDFETEFKTAQKLNNSPGLFNSVRLYTCVQSGTVDTPISAFAAALATNTSMLLGIWASGTNTVAPELRALNSALTQYGQRFADLVVGISVGSEDLYRNSQSGIENQAGIGNNPSTVITFIKDVRNAISGTPLAKKPVGHVDSWSAWSNTSNVNVLRAVDFIGTDLYPYYEKDKGNDISNLTNVYDYTFGQVTNAVIKANISTPIWITETGWPVSGPDFGLAKATVQNAKTYWDSIGCGKLFGRTNVWWYNLRDSNPANKEKFGVSKDLSTTGVFDLKCPDGSGAPASINTTPTKSSAVRVDAGHILALIMTLVLILFLLE
jgi:glucan endo-1,3-beta-D-glucosidase